MSGYTSCYDATRLPINKQGNLSDENSSTSVTPDPLDSFNEGTVEEEKPESKPAPVFVSPQAKPGEIIIPGQRDPVDPLQQ